MRAGFVVISLACLLYTTFFFFSFSFDLVFFFSVDAVLGLFLSYLGWIRMGRVGREKRVDITD